jgi:hypothetical protein
MKKVMITFVMAIFMSAVFLTICGHGRRDAIQSNRPECRLVPVSFTAKDSASSYKEFRERALFNITNNNWMLVRLNTIINCNTKQSKARHFSNLIELQTRNNELKRRVLEYREYNQNSWLLFEARFTEAMNDLQTTIRNFRVTTEVMI